MVPFAAYLRTSTDDHQSPTDSAAWQLRLARQLIEPTGGEIVVTYHDVDQSRSIPWERRPQAARLLDVIRNPGRPWTDLVIAEPQRAFAGNQFGLVYPVLVHYGISLWVRGRRPGRPRLRGARPAHEPLRWARQGRAQPPPSPRPGRYSRPCLLGPLSRRSTAVRLRAHRRRS